MERCRILVGLLPNSRQLDIDTTINLRKTNSQMTILAIRLPLSLIGHMIQVVALKRLVRFMKAFGKFDVIPVKVKSGGSGYEFDASKKTEAATVWPQTKLSEMERP